MRNVAAAALAIPVLALVYVSALLGRSVLARVAASLGIGTLVGLGVIGIGDPSGTTATPPGQVVPLTSAAFTTDLRTGQAPDAPIRVAFSMPMDPGSVRAHLAVDPATPVVLDWDEARTTLVVRPARTWATGRLHTITIEPGALATTGRPLSRPVRAVFLTRPATEARIEPTRTAGSRVRPSTAFIVEFDGPMDEATVPGAFAIEPAVDGTLERLGRRGGNRWQFTPSEPLAPDTAYTLRVSALARDADGAALAAGAELVVRTPAAPRVVRFRPRDGEKGIDRDARLSVRFTEPMDRRATRRAFSVTSNGTTVEGRVRFAEGSTVLVFEPDEALGYGRTIVMTVSADARSAAGVELAEPARATITTEPKPAPRPRRSVAISTGGGSVGSGSWTAVESYYLRLMNCTRTGGLVTSTGACSSPGGRDVAPLKLDAGISSKVSRPYAKLLATRGLCSHFIGGDPGDRLRRAGYTSYIWAENLGCRSGDPYKAVLGSHLYFQSERSWDPPGGHYVNLMSTKYDRAGIGVWVSSGRVRLVVNFYRPR